jgi:hypothetical protein
MKKFIVDGLQFTAKTADSGVSTRVAASFSLRFFRVVPFFLQIIKPLPRMTAG